MRTCSRRGSAAPLSLLRGCRSLHEELLSQTDHPPAGLRTRRSQKTRLGLVNKIAGTKLSQQGATQAACGVTSVAPCLEGPSATRSATTLTRMILSRPTTVSRGKPVSGMPLIFMGSGFISIITGTLGSSQPLRLPTSGSVSTLPFFSVPSTTLCFQDPAASLRTSQRAESLASRPVSATRTYATPTTEVQRSLWRGTGERCRGLSHKGSRTDTKSQLERSKEMKFRGTTYRRMISKEMRSREKRSKERRAHRMTSVETKSRGMTLGRMKSQGRSHHVVNQ